MNTKSPERIQGVMLPPSTRKHTEPCERIFVDISDREPAGLTAGRSFSATRIWETAAVAILRGQFHGLSRDDLAVERNARGPLAHQVALLDPSASHGESLDRNQGFIRILRYAKGHLSLLIQIAAGKQNFQSLNVVPRRDVLPGNLYFQVARRCGAETGFTVTTGRLFVAKRKCGARRRRRRRSSVR